MIRKLKTLKEFKDEFKPLADRWVEYEYYCIEYNNMIWIIDTEKIKKFGTEVEVKEIYDKDYTHYGKGFFWHELWFEPEFKKIEFLSMEEVEI